MPVPDLQQLLLDELTPEELLALPLTELDSLLLTGQAIICQADAKHISCKFQRNAGRLTITFRQFDGSCDKVFRQLWDWVYPLAGKLGCSEVEWFIPAAYCNQPNPRLRHVLEQKVFQLVASTDMGEVYYLRHRHAEFRRHLDIAEFLDSNRILLWGGYGRYRTRCIVQTIAGDKLVSPLKLDLCLPTGEPLENARIIGRDSILHAFVGTTWYQYDLKDLPTA